MINTVVYIKTECNDKTGLGVAAGHAYTYDGSKMSKKRLQKNLPTPHGYYVENEKQHYVVTPIEYIRGFAHTCKKEFRAFLLFMKEVLEFHDKGIENDKILIISSNKKHFDKLTEEKDKGELFESVKRLYLKNKTRIILDFDLFHKGGVGCDYALRQLGIAKHNGDANSEEKVSFIKESEKKYNKPDAGLAACVKEPFLYINTGDKSDFYTLSSDNRRTYMFGRPEPKKFHGKNTPDAVYGLLASKSPIDVLDKLYEHIKKRYHNVLNHQTAVNLSLTLSKEVLRDLDAFPYKFEGNMMNLPTYEKKEKNEKEPLLAEVLDKGLGYRIVDEKKCLLYYYNKFINRNSKQSQDFRYDDITDKLLINDGKKISPTPEFKQSAVHVTIYTEAPGCVAKVRITLGIGYDIPEVRAFTAMLKDKKIKNLKVYLGLNFIDKNRVLYHTIIDCDEFTYVYINAKAGYHVYSKRELGIK